MIKGRGGPSPYLEAVAVDNSIPIDQVAVDLWLKDAQNRLRWFVRPLLQLIFAIVLLKGTNSMDRTILKSMWM